MKLKLKSRAHYLQLWYSTSFTSSTFCSSTCSLYCAIQLIFTTKWILIEIGSHNLAVLVNTTFSIKYRLTYVSTSFFTSLSLNTKFFILNITLLLFFYFFTSLLLLSTYYFTSSCIFLSAASTTSYISFILYHNLL